jgi:hypothetical protein
VTVSAGLPVPALTSKVPEPVLVTLTGPWVTVDPPPLTGMSTVGPPTPWLPPTVKVSGSGGLAVAGLSLPGRRPDLSAGLVALS